MVEPLTTALAIARVAALMKQGFVHFTREFPQYPDFWKPFEKRLKNDPNIPWDAIEEKAHYDPEFIGIVLALMAGAADARERLATYFEFVEAREGPYEDRETVLKRILETAEVVANEVVPDDQRPRIQRLLIEETVEREGEKTREYTAAWGEMLLKEIRQREPFRDEASILEVEVIEQLLQGWSPSDESEEQARDEALEKAASALARMRSHPVLAGQAVDEERLREATEAAFREGQEVERERRQEQSQAETKAALREPGPESAPSGESVEAPVEPDGPTAIGDAAVRVLTQLEEQDGEAAERFRGILAEAGHIGVAKVLEADSDLSTSALVGGARLVAQWGMFTEAERAFMRAAEQEEEPFPEARQVVRAAAMAQSRGDEERSNALLAKAEELSPNHPALAITEARNNTDATAMLERLADLDEPEDKDERALLHVVRGTAHLNLNEFEQAAVELDEAEKANPDNPSVLEARALSAWMRYHADAEDKPAREELLAAAEHFEGLASEMAQQGRTEIETDLLARAAESYAFAAAPAEGARILEGLDEVDAMPLGTRERLADAALLSHRADLIGRFLSAADDSPIAKLLLADGALLGDSDESERATAATDLETLLDAEDEGLRARAAYALASGSSLHADVPWSETAAKIVRDRKPLVEAFLRAEWQRLDGDKDGAEATLLTYAGDPRILRQLRDYAAQDEEWSKARDRSRALFELTGEAEDRLGLADTSRRAGDAETAEREFLALARAPEVPTQIRAAAFAGAMEVVGADRNYTATHALAKEWHAAVPDDSNGLWNLLFALARLARHDEAHELVGREDPDADIPERALLLAEILSRAAPRAEALERIAELSDRFDRKVEGLEAAFLQASLGAEQAGAEIPEPLIERTKETWANFRTRFPDTEFVQVFEAPTTPEEFVELMKRVGSEDSVRLQKEAFDAIRDGTGPVNSVTAFSPSAHVGGTWLRLNILPLGFSTDPSDEADRETARAALGGAAVWDASSLFISGGLGADHADQVFGALPGSVIANDTLADADQEVVRAPSEGQLESVSDPDDPGHVGLRKLPDEEVKRARFMAEGMLALAKRFRSEPGASSGSNSQLAELHEESPESAWKALTGTLALAERLDLPVFSDDRWIREQARGMNIPAFGTVALLDVLAERQVISAEERVRLRQMLMRNQAWGLRPQRDELVDLAERSGWQPSHTLFGGLNDRATWRAQPAHYWSEVLGLLESAFETAEDELRPWLLRAIDSFLRATPEFPETGVVELILLAAWPIDERENRLSEECFRRLVREVKDLPPWVPVPGEPVLSAISSLMGFFDGQPTQVQFAIFRQIANRLEWADRTSAYLTFVDWSAAQSDA